MSETRAADKDAVVKLGFKDGDLIQEFGYDDDVDFDLRVDLKDCIGSEILDEDEAQELRIHGGDKGEFGATTGRPRRIGWFDCVATRYGVECQGATKIAMTALDCLSYLDEIKVCTAYKIGDDITKDFPNTSLLKKAKPVFTTLKGWHCNIKGIRNFSELPREAQEYVEFIEKELGHKINMVSNGPEREAIIYR